ncbi:hypothetical protein EAH68_12740 [Corynebacterium hylobatis]|uniref:Uncharacterized protein n=2 Tax=Corynebacterium hylobatis TaxID=1859290 RepID=A0A3R9ZCB3_9CORY|nr:hypothetical protein EAH68_12740 [Corynebacterium hylobatis]
MTVDEARDYIARMEARGHDDLMTLKAARTIVAQADEIAELARARDAALVDAQDYKIRLHALLDDEEGHYG